MHQTRYAVAFVTVALCSPALAQQPTTVQLPTFSIFTVSTTVSVPDGGGVYLGGVDRAASGRVDRGPGAPFRNRAIGSAASSSGMHVSATIIDHAEMDAAVLAAAAAKRGGAAIIGDKAFAVLAESEVRSTSGPGHDSASSRDLSVAEIRRRQAATEDTQSAEGTAYLAKAQFAAKEGKAGLAKVYYRMALSRLTGTAAQQAKAQLQSLGER